MLSSCKAHEWTYMKWRHDRALYVLVRAVFTARRIAMPAAYREYWGRAVPGSFGSSSTTEILVDQVIQTDRVVENRRPDLVVRMPGERRIVIMEVAAAFEPCIREREFEKRNKYRELAADLARQHPSWRVKTIPVVLGDLGTLCGLRGHLEDSGLFWPSALEETISLMQREVICASADLLVKHLTL